MTVTQSEIRPGVYYDSVVLMQLQKGLATLPHILDAGVVMATPANKELLAASELLPTHTAAKADDLLIVVKGVTETAVVDALKQVDTLLQQRRTTNASQSFRPRSLANALKILPNAAWVLVSVPGRYAATVARQALDANKHLFLYSDNVSLKDEVALKQMARDKGLLVMGPDCGTAIINGMGLGFANRVRGGHIGLVGASGTGLQAITSEIHNLGSGISQAIGTGGRDLKAEVGAISATQALDVLKRDPNTHIIVLVSKPPAPAVASELLQAAQATNKPVVVNFIGYPPPGRQSSNLYFATSLSETAELAVQLLNAGTQDVANEHPALAGYVRGLFSGGTLAYEAMLGLQTFLAPLYSNVPIRPEQQMDDPLISQAHTVIDMGDDVFTQGRLHPMMDNALRLRRLHQEAANPNVGFILLDVVLGEGAHADPASELAPAIAEIRAERSRMEHPLKIIIIVVGTDDDPQDLNTQIERFIAAGATVFANINEAVDYIFNRLPRLAPTYPEVNLDAFGGEFTAVNVGLEIFHDSLQAQGAHTIHVDWRPPAGGNETLMALLAKMK